MSKNVSNKIAHVTEEYVYINVTNAGWFLKAQWNLQACIPPNLILINFALYQQSVFIGFI